MSTLEARQVALEGLLHDSAEAYIGDMIRPLKHQPEMIEFRRAEAAIERCVRERFGLTPTEESAELVKSLDDRILVDEVSVLVRRPDYYLEPPSPLAGVVGLGCTIWCLQPAQAEEAFLIRFHNLRRYPA